MSGPALQIAGVMPGVHAFIAELWQAYAWDTGDGIVLIDSGIAGSAMDIIGALSEIGYTARDVREIVVTHSHADHCGALGELVALTGADSVAHQLDAPVIGGTEPQPPTDLTDEERPFAEAIVPRVPPAPPFPVTRSVRDGARVHGGGQLIHVPGHTPGSMALYVPELRLLFTGDTIAAVNGRAILGPFNVDRERAKQSVRRLADLDFDVACFGHGAPLTEGAAAAVRRLAERL